ncbi:alpha-E domain-containing protein [Mucilaginibacter sp. RS28]|uniref:Alpha-E domain-containing protein n=1 Tax=Mucilaginibacter straminoryzae TaxID=2932774 RepID=A0A9X1X5H8_9SPHI|nr:alpha-E domain-containing protein [Mucilaginibacter straminoryzae]MCJ8211313.1 alpha-E domain-containing protein [Mucilaginibacter straminoryzae]
MLSRVAASFYWLSRYVERSDGILRMLKINYASSQDAIHGFTWDPVIGIFAGGDYELAGKLQNDSRAVIKYMVSDKENQNSIISIVTMARENARSVQEHISTDLWQCLNEYYHTVKDINLGVRFKKEDPISVLDVLIKQVMLYYGTAEVTMERGPGRSFMNIGKYLERAIQSIDVLMIKFNSISDNPDLITDTTYWKHLLLSLGGYEIYLKTYRDGLEAQNVLEQVILNNDFPRSVIYSVDHIQRYFNRLQNDSSLSAYQEVSFYIGKLQSRIKYTPLKTLQGAALHEFLTGIKDELYQIGNLLNERYFANS